MRYAGVIVLYNPDNEIYDNIQSYIDEVEKLYVVDNTEEKNMKNMKFKSKKIKYIPLKENKGIAYALNKGAKEAIKEGYDWLLTMDQDSKFENNSLKKMKQFIEELKAKKFIRDIVDYDYKKLGLVSPLHRTLKNKKDEIYDLSRPLVVMTSGNLISLDAYKKINGFKDWLFIDVVDYCLNLRNHGYEIVQINSAEMTHNLGDLVKHKFLGKTVYTSNHSVTRRYYISRNRHYLYDMYHDKFPLYCNLECACTKKELYKIWLFEKEKIAKTKAIYKGYKDYKKSKKGMKGN